MSQRHEAYGYDNTHYERPNMKYVCGKAKRGECSCPLGPDKKGKCQGGYRPGKNKGERNDISFECSPKKTIEGFLGGVVGGVLLGVVLGQLLPSGLNLRQQLFFGFLLAVCGVFGDLSISLLKRSADIKDSGHLLPGHGGLLDRVDGLLFASPLLFFLCTSPLAALLR
jgi:CDP-diglyceride synthetase